MRVLFVSLLLLIITNYGISGKEIRMKGSRKQVQNPVLKEEEIPSTQTELLGVVLDGQTGEPLPSATLMLKPDDIGVLSDIDGKFYFKLQEGGTKTLTIQYTGYQTKEIANFEVVKGKAKNITITLTPKELTTDEVVITSTIETEREVAAIFLQKRNMTFSDVYSSEVLLKTTSNLNLSNALKRMPSVSFIDERNIVIRGLIDRYTLFTINGIPVLPNRFDPQSFDYNLFPIIGVQMISMNKNTDASMFAGASASWIDLKTPTIPDKTQFEVGTLLEYNDRASFRKLQRFAPKNPSKISFLQKVEGLPDDLAPPQTIQSLPYTSDTLAQEGKKLPNNVDPQNYNALFNSRWYFKAYKRWQKNKNIWGFLLLLTSFPIIHPKTGLFLQPSPLTLLSRLLYSIEEITI